MKKTLTTLLLALSINLLFAQYNDWIHKQSEGDIEVFYRDNSQTGLRELKMVFFVESNTASIVQLLQDVSNYDNWIYKLQTAHIIERIDANSYYYYNTMDFPWPMADRDMIGKSRFWQDKNGVVHSALEAAPNKLPQKEDFIRIPTIQINWDLYPQEDDRVKVEYALQSDPGGSIPTWAINLVIEQGPLQTVKNMRKQLESGKYDKAHFAWLQN